jgi:chromosome segregation ATPase
MEDRPITTSIDDLVKYLNEHGESDANTLANALNVGENIISTWADVLEKARLVKINYKLGKMFVSPMAMTKEGAEVAKKTIEVKKGVAETELVAQINMINQINTRLDEFKRYVTGAEGAFRSKAGEIKEVIDQIDKLGLQVDGSYKKLRDKKNYIDALSQRLDKETQKLEQKAKAVEIMGGRDAESRSVILDVKAKLDDAEDRIKTLNKNFDVTLEENRKGFAELFEGIRIENRALRDMIAQQEKQIQDYASFLTSYKKESDAIKRQAAKDRIKMLDDIAKASDETRKVYGTAENDVNEVRRKLFEMKSQFGGYADLSDKLNGIKNSINSISKQKDELQKQLEEIREQLRTIELLDESKIAQKEIDMEKAEKKMADTNKKAETLKKDEDKIRSDIDEIAK